MMRWPGLLSCHLTATRPTRSRSALYRRQRWPQSMPQRGSIGIGCRVACQILRASGPTHAATASSRVVISPGSYPVKTMVEHSGSGWSASIGLTDCSVHLASRHHAASRTPGFPQAPAETLAPAPRTWFDTYSGRAATKLPGIYQHLADIRPGFGPGPGGDLRKRVPKSRSHRARVSLSAAIIGYAGEYRFCWTGCRPGCGLNLNPISGRWDSSLL